jgi:hypothetical protein
MEPVMSLLVRLALAVLFAAAAVHKLRDRRRFDGIVLDYRLLPPRAAVRVAAALPWTELALAAALIAAPRAGLGAAVILIGTYIVAMGVNLARGRRLVDCGCGARPQRLSGWRVAGNLVLAGAALWAASAQSALNALNP